MDSMSPADLRAVTHDDDDGLGGSWMWIIVLFLFMFGGGGFNRFGGGEYGQYATAAAQQDILFGQKFSDLNAKLNQIGNGICDSTFALNNTILNSATNTNNSIVAEGRALQAQLAQCCCDNRLAIASLAAQGDKQTCAITTAIHAEGEATRALIQTNEIQALRDKIASLEMDNRMCGVVRYPNSITYSGGTSPFCGCNSCA